MKAFLDFTAAQFGHREAYMWLENDLIVSRSFIEWRDDATRMATIVRRRFGTGQKIALIGEMSYVWICAYHGIINSGNVSVPLDTKLSAPELAERLRFADVSVVFLAKKYHHLEEEITRECGEAMTFLSLENSLEELPGISPEKLEPVDPDSLASLMFTSGTSGDGLKAAMITQRAMLADVTGPVPLCVPGDRLLSVLPIHHCFEIFVGQMKYLYLGGTICINDNMANLIPNLSRFGITIVVAVPALANMLAGFIAANLRMHSIDEVRQMLGGKLRRITIGGASVSEKVLGILSQADITLFVGYGLTETAGGCLANCDASIRPREAGAPYVIGMQMKLVDGELCLKGPMVMEGYYKSPELTAKVMHDGWFHTGDLAEITNEGYVIIRGRKDNMIKTPNGEKVYPEDWEDRLHSITGVTSAMVANVRQHLTAILFLKDDTQALREAIISAVDAINAQLPNHEKVLDIRFREKPFPMTTSMKIRRREVMREMEEESQPTGACSPVENDEQKYVLDQVLKVLPADTAIGIDDNLFDCGMDSLLAIHLALLLDCDPSMVYMYRTVRQLAGHVRSEPAVKTASRIKDINHFISVRPEASDGIGEAVLLTGANGYLGVHLLTELTAKGYKVICLVRNDASLDKACRYFGISFPGHDIEVVIGDVTKQCLGLAAEQYNDLCARVKTVFHTAALVNHVGSEEASSRVNVEGTKEIIRFCEKAGAKLFHMSSYAVTGFGTDAILTEDVLDIGQSIDQNPYIKTKYQAEEQVLQARGRSVPSTIFRIGNLTARASDGLFQMNAETSGMSAQLNAIRKLGIFPESMRRILYDATAVDEAARAIILLAESFGAGYIWHIINPHARTLAQLTEANAVPDAEFISSLAANGTDRDIVIMSVYYRMIQEGFNSGFDSSATQETLEKLGFAWQ